jgi:hypothetical protein
MQTVAECRADVKKACERIIRVADSDAAASLAEVEAELWTLLLALGRALVALFLARQAARARAAEYTHAGTRYWLRQPHTSEIGTRFGKVSFTRWVGRPADRRRGRRDLPVDRDLGLVGGFSLGTVSAVTRLCAQMAFASARTTFASFCEWQPSQRTVLRMVDAVGAEARGFLEQAPPPDGDGDILVIQVDGRGAPMITVTEDERRRQPRRATEGTGTVRHQRRRRRRAHSRPRRRKGDKSKNAKVAFVGVIYTLRSTDDGCEGPINKRLQATFDSHEALFGWLRAEADKRGYGAKRTLFLADGADTIWRLQQDYFPQAECCLDWFHVVEKLWDAGRCLHPEGSPELTAWVAARTRELRGRSGAAKVLDALTAAHQSIARTGPGTKTKRERLLEIQQHLAKNQHRMRYRDLRRDDLDIGSGAVEGAVRNLVGMRLDGPGMRWGRDRSEHVLHLRCILLNSQWDEFTAYLSTRHLQLAPVPVPTRPHEAKRKEAA